MYIKVFVKPGARREEVEDSPTKGGERDTLLVAVKEPATGNRANQRVRELVALRFGKPVGKVRILTGHRSRSKMISIDS